MAVPRLYTMSASLYSAKARSYLRKHRIDHVEVAAGHPDYLQRVMPAVGRWIIPVLEEPDGTLVQDTVDIIDHLEARVPPERSAYPATPVHRALAHVLELFGGEGLLRPAMHYRWNFDAENLAFLEQDFGGSLAPGADTARKARVFARSSDRMRRAALGFGVHETSVPAIEASYAEFLALFDAHLQLFPYLLGGRPTLGDFAFMGPLHGHLARDPYPSLLMKQQAPRVWRWVERMSAPVDDTPEYGDHPADIFPDDNVPETLAALLRYVADEHVAEMLAQVEAVDAWLAEHPEIATGDVVGGKPTRRGLGTVTFEWRGQPLTVGVTPYRLYVLQRLQDSVDAVEDADRKRVVDVLTEAGLDPLLGARARRRVERRDNREVWGPEHS